MERKRISSTETQTIGDRIALLLRQLNMTQIEMVRQLKTRGVTVNKSYISRIIKDEIENPRLEVLFCIGDILDIDMEELLRGNQRPSVDSSISPRVLDAAMILEDMDDEVKEIVLEAIGRYAMIDSKLRAADRRIMELQTEILTKQRAGTPRAPAVRHIRARSVLN